MNGQENKRPPYVTIQYDTIDKLAISWAEAVLLDMVAKLSVQRGYCYKSTAAIARDMHMTFNAIKIMKKRLIARELLVETSGGLQCGQAYLELLTERVETSETAKSAIIAKSATSKSAKSAIRLQKVQPIAKSSDKNNSIDIQETSTNVLVPDKPTRPSNLTIALQNVITALGKDPKRVTATDGRKAKLKTRANHMGYQTVLKAARNLSQDAYMTGDNPAGKDYATIDYLLRNDENIDKWANHDENTSNLFDLSKELLP